MRCTRFSHAGSPSRWCQNSMACIIRALPYALVCASSVSAYSLPSAAPPRRAGVLGGV